MEQAKNRLQRVINYMKKPEFLLLLGLVNLFLILGMGSRLHGIMYFNNGGYGMQQSHMMQRGYDNHRGREDDFHRGRGMMNQPQYNAPQNTQAQPEANAPVDQPSPQASATGTTTP